MPGLLAGIALISLPMFGDFFTTNLLSGSPSTRMIGNEIDFFINKSQTAGARGAGITLLLVLFTAIFMIYYLLSPGTLRTEPTRAIDRAFGARWSRESLAQVVDVGIHPLDVDPRSDGCGLLLQRRPITLGLAGSLAAVVPRRRARSSAATRFARRSARPCGSQP